MDKIALIQSKKYKKSRFAKKIQRTAFDIDIINIDNIFAFQ